MRLVAAGLTEELVIDTLDCFALMRLAQGHILVRLVESGGSARSEVDEVAHDCVLDRLTAAVDAAAGAAHDLDEVIVGSAVLDLLHNRVGVCKSADYADLYLHAVDGVGSFLYSVGAANLGEVEALELLAGELLNGGSQRRFHNAACCAEDNGRAGGVAQRIVKLLVGQVLEVYSRALDHSAELSRGQRVVNIRIAGRRLIVALGLELLRRAGHDADNDDILRVDAHLLGIPGLDYRARHLLGRFAGREVIEHIGVVMLAVFYPSGRAGGYHREHAAVLDPAEELVCLFDNREVCAEVGVKDLVEAEASERRDHLALNIGADVHSEALAESDADRRSGVNNDELLGIVDSLENLCGVVLLIYSAGRAVDNALAAGDARHGIERSLERRADVGVKSAGVCADNGDVLSLACCDAAAAENALAVVSYHMNSGIVVFVDGICAVEAPLVVNAELLAELLELAGSAAYAGETLSVMRRKNELKGHLAALADALGVCEYLHTLVNGVYAGGHERTRALDLDHADAACADLVYLLEVAEGRDLNAGHTRRLKYGYALGYAQGHVVYLYVYHFHAVLTLLP